jgi:hypothetical protein
MKLNEELSWLNETAGTSRMVCELTSIICQTIVLSNSTNTYADIFGPGITRRPLHMSFRDGSLTCDSDIYASTPAD